MTIATAMTFEQARRKMPSCVCGGIDPWQHKTVEDLAWLVQHELNLHWEST